jgi:hypothetical protein
MARLHSKFFGILPFVVLILVGAPGVGADEAADLGHVVGLARVTYVSGSSVYIDAGREHGLESGQTLEVLRDGQEIGHVRIDNISAIRAACKIVDGEPILTVGDLVRLPIPGGGSESIRSFDEGLGSFVVHPTPDDPQAAAAAGDASTPGAAAALSDSVDTTGTPGLARVRHVDQNRVFIDSGENKGLRGGDNVRVLRANTSVAVLEVTDVGTDRAACKVVDGVADLDVGDLVRLPIRGDGDDSGPVPAYEVPETIMVVRPSADAIRGIAPTTSMAKATVNGRVGLRYLMVQDRDADGGQFSQPALDLRLDAMNMASGHIDMAVDVRSRRTYRAVATSEDEVQDQTRVYRLAASVHDRRGRFRLIAGRQFSPTLASVSTFDGVLASFNGNRVSTGLFAGTQPDPLTFGRSDEVEEYGAFVQVHNRPGRHMQWSVTTGGIGSYQNGVVNREYAYLQALLTSQRVSLYATQEIDYNRDWKVLAGEDQVSPTSSYLHFGVRPTRDLNLRVGYDNRRNIRLYRDLITPETDFDDTFRRGYWGGFTQRIARRFRVGLNAKRSTSDTAGNADTFTLIFGATGLARRFNFFYRGSYYTNDISQGSLQSLTSGVIITRQLRMTLMGGLRQDNALATPDVQARLVWYGLGWDVSLGRHWFMQLSGERTDGEFEKNDQVYFSTTYRF